MPDETGRSGRKPARRLGLMLAVVALIVAVLVALFADRIAFPDSGRTGAVARDAPRTG